jgi:hypothetical protein
MIDALDSGEERTRRAVTPSDKKQSPAKREELNLRSQPSRFTSFRGCKFTIWDTFFVLLRGNPGVRRGKLGVLCLVHEEGGRSRFGNTDVWENRVSCRGVFLEGRSRIIPLFSSRISQFHGRPQ